MRIRILSLALLAIALPISSCSDNGILEPISLQPSVMSNHGETAPPQIRISEIHYDNTGTDAGEAIEISGPAGADVTGWKIYLYNGSGGVTYEPTRTLTGSIPSSCGSRGVLVQTYAVNGIQNGPPDAIALVNAAGHVIEFLSYEGTFAATNGPAIGMTSTQIPVSEAGTEPVGQSIKRRGSGANVWEGPAASDFGACNDNQAPPPPPAVIDRVELTPGSATVEQGSTQQFTAVAYDAADQPIAGAPLTWSTSNANASVNSNGLARGELPGDAQIIVTSANGKTDAAELHIDALPLPPEVRMSEIHYDNFGTDFAEAVEVEGPAGTDVTGWKVVLYNGSGGVQYDEFLLDGLIPATQACNGRGVVYTLATGIQNGGPDGLALVDAAGVVVEFLSYEGTFIAADGPAAGRASKDVGIFEDGAAANTGRSMQRNAAGTSWANAPYSFGVCNGTGVTPPPFGNTITFSGRVAGDPPLPVGFEDQIFATLRDGSASGAAITSATFTWVSETPSIASIDEDGVMRALSAGTARVRATANDGTTGTYSLPTHVATASGVNYDGNAEFGEPSDDTPADEFIIRRDQLITSFNVGKGTPNWVAYEIDASHFGPQDRCDCFTYDPELPAAGRYTTADYTGAGAFHGYEIDRGHLARSFDRTSGSLDNAYTYYFSNIIPQAGDNNRGPWGAFETYLGNFARSNGKEVYVITGPAGNKGTVKNEGRIVIPTDTWKVAVIMPKDQGIESVNSYDDVEVIAVIMPNVAGIRNVDWQTYKRTVDQVEALTGYDLLNLLRDDIEIAVESNTRPPVAAVDGPYDGTTGTPVAMSGGQSTDPEGDALSYAWRFGDGETAIGKNVSHAYASRGTFNVRLIVTDIHNLSDTVNTTASITARPVAATDGPYIGIAGDPVTMSGARSTDADGDALSYAWSFGDGATGSGENVSHTYSGSGRFTVRLIVTDTRGHADTVNTTVTITSRPVARTNGPYSGIEGESVAMSGSQSTDADGDALSYAWRFGDGGTGSGENVAHTYSRGGTFEVRLIVTDTRGLADTVTTNATIATWSQATGNAAVMVGQLKAAGKITAGDAKWLENKLEIAQKHYQNGLNTAADNQLEQILRRLDHMVESGDAREADIAALRSLVTRIMNASS